MKKLFLLFKKSRELLIILSSSLFVLDDFWSYGLMSFIVVRIYDSLRAEQTNETLSNVIKATRGRKVKSVNFFEKGQLRKVEFFDWSG